MIPGLDRLREHCQVHEPSGRLIGGAATRLLLDEAGLAFWAGGDAGQRRCGAGGVDEDGVHAGTLAVAVAGVVGAGLWLDTGGGPRWPGPDRCAASHWSLRATIPVGTLVIIGG